jgi:hypothetical protein
MSLRKPRLASPVGDGLGDGSFNPEDGKAAEMEQLHVVLKAIAGATHASERGYRGDDASEKNSARMSCYKLSTHWTTLAASSMFI